jgi:mannose-6-phosphate isomerase-like protein (cupin superfamily)
MPEQPYFDQAGEPSDEPGRFVHVDDLDPLPVMEGLEFRPVTTDSVMTNFVTFEPDAPAPMHHHVEQQIAIVLSGELNFTVGGETKAMHAGDWRRDPAARPARRRSGPGGVHGHRRLHTPARGHRRHDGALSVTAP